MDIVIGKQAVNIRASHVLLVQIEHGDIRVILENHTGYNLVSYLQIISGTVFLYVFPHLYDFTGSLMSEGYGNQSEGIFFEFMGVGTADTAALHFNKDIVIPYLGDGEFFNVIMLQACKHGNTGCFRDFSRHISGYAFSRAGMPFHAVKDLSYNLFYIRCINVHFLFLSCLPAYMPFYRHVCTFCPLADAEAV